MKPLLKLSEHGQSFWLDNLTRRMIHDGSLQRRVEREGLCGVTSNPAIFHKAISQSSDYDSQIHDLVRHGRSVEEIYHALVIKDVQDACDILRPVYDQTRAHDGYVSLEVSPHLAHDTAGSIQEARVLFQAVNRPNVLIKIPGTAEGVPAIETLLFEGINVNITLLFSIAQYEAVAEAYLRALERRAAAGHPVENIASVASFFLSRIDSLVDQLLSHRPTRAPSGDVPSPRDLRGKTAVANAKLAYQSFKKFIASDRWRKLAAKGTHPQRMLWASTSTKDPGYSDVMYVEPLIGPHTVNTMPDATVEAFADHGVVHDTVEHGVDAARRVMADLETLGIDLRLVTEQLQNEGVQKFIEPYDALLAGLGEQCRRFRDDFAAEPLHAVATRLRRAVIEMTTAAGSGHPSSCLSCADVVAALFFREMRWDPTDPEARDVDRFILSKGHAAPVLWAALRCAGAIGDDLNRLRQLDSTLEGHPTPLNPWVKVATGSLGQGLAAANGIALANRLDGIDARVFCLLGDGECSEGSVWESAQFASLHKLNRLVAIVDVNGLGQSGPAPYRHDTQVLRRRFEAFGWHAVEVDGHNMAQLLEAFAQARQTGPTAILARTVKGKGVPLLEGAHGWHGKALNEEQRDQALQHLGSPEGESAPVVPTRVGRSRAGADGEIRRLQLSYEPGQAVATRLAFGQALRSLGEQSERICVLDADVKNSTYTELFAEEYPERFFESAIAEQNMAGTGLGLAACGKIPYVATFACFLSRAFDFVRMAGHSRPAHLVFCGSHAGVSIGEDGPSQMGLEDMAMFRAVSGSTVLYPCDAVSAARLTEEAARTQGIVYLRTTRSKTPVIYPPDADFPVGGSKVLRRSQQDQYTIVAAGITLHEALAAHDALQGKGVATRVIDAYSVKPIDRDTLLAAARDTHAIVVVEDHWVDGGLGDAVAAAVSGTVPVYRLGIREEPRSGTPEELLERHRISRRTIEHLILDRAAQAA